MKQYLKYSLVALALALGSTSHAHAFGWPFGPPPIQPPPPTHHKGGNTAPEIDPSLAIGSFALLGGSLTVLRSRRRK